MPSYIVKPDRDLDFYVVWSTVTDSPHYFGERAYVQAHYDQADADRLARADVYGSSAQWPDPTRPIYGWEDEGFVYEQRGWLRRDRLRAACDRLAVDDRADIADLLEPFDDETEVLPA